MFTDDNVVGRDEFVLHWCHDRCKRVEQGLSFEQLVLLELEIRTGTRTEAFLDLVVVLQLFVDDVRNTENNLSIDKRGQRKRKGAVLLTKRAMELICEGKYFFTSFSINERRSHSAFSRALSASDGPSAFFAPSCSRSA